MQKESIEQKARDMIYALKSTEEYINYLNYKSLLANKPELWDKISTFRKKAFEIQVNQNYGQFEAYERLAHLKSDYEEELQNPIVNAFLDADYQLCRSMQRVYQIIAEELDYDIQFLD
ncbi:YlbF family regulator [Clostridiales bacterium COT073_COT-073]|nr:YlbF family regulator [Clostridiales bacterium COT073_COT-073]